MLTHTFSTFDWKSYKIVSSVSFTRSLPSLLLSFKWNVIQIIALYAQHIYINKCVCGISRRVAECDSRLVCGSYLTRWLCFERSRAHIHIKYKQFFIVRCRRQSPDEIITQCLLRAFDSRVCLIFRSLDTYKYMHITRPYTHTDKTHTQHNPVRSK